MKVKFLGAIAVALLLVLMFAVVAQAAVPQSTIDAIIKDAQDGTIDGNWTAAEIRAALAYIQDNPRLPAVFGPRGRPRGLPRESAGSRRTGRSARVHRR